MNLNDIAPAIQQIENQPAVNDLRGRTYLATYPSMLAVGNVNEQIGIDRLHQLSAMVYGWMPRIVRLDPMHINAALNALQQAQAAKHNDHNNVEIGDIANCLHSVVGASKILHFVNPNVFPIWDSNIEQFRLRREPPYNQMSRVENYLEYVGEVHEIRQENDFDEFYQGILHVLRVRLEENDIVAYEVSEVRAIESAAFELSQR